EPLCARWHPIAACILAIVHPLRAAVPGADRERHSRVIGIARLTGPQRRSRELVRSGAGGGIDTDVHQPVRWQAAHDAIAVLVLGVDLRELLVPVDRGDSKARDRNSVA